MHVPVTTACRERVTSRAEIQASTLNIPQAMKVPGQCSVQKVKIKDRDGNLVETVAMLNSGSNTSFISKNETTKPGSSGPKVHLTMNLAGVSKNYRSTHLKGNHSEAHASLYTINKPCCSAKTVSGRTVNSYQHLEAIANKLYLIIWWIHRRWIPKGEQLRCCVQANVVSRENLQRKNCVEEAQVEIQKLLEQEYIPKIKQVDHNVPEWCLHMQAVLTPDRATNLPLVYDASAKRKN